MSPTIAGEKHVNSVARVRLQYVMHPGPFSYTPSLQNTQLENNESVLQTLQTEFYPAGPRK